MREEILALLSGQKIGKVPTFSGLIHITAEGLESESIALHEAQHDANKMAKAAASTFRLTGMPSAALPLDLCAPAEALGITLNFYEGSNYQFPQPARALFALRSLPYLLATYRKCLVRFRYPCVEFQHSALPTVGSWARLLSIP